MKMNTKITDIARPLFESLSYRIAGKASVEIGMINGELSIKIDPFLHTAAKISAKIVDGEGIYLFLGHGSVFEIPLRGGRYTDMPCQNEAIAICEATIKGNLREIVYTKDNNVVGAKSELQMDGQVISSSWRQFLTNPFRKTIESKFAYSPY